MKRRIRPRGNRGKDGPQPVHQRGMNGHKRARNRDRTGQNPGKDKEKNMGRLIKVVFVLAILGFAGLVGYAYFGVQEPTPREVTKPVVLDAN